MLSTRKSDSGRKSKLMTQNNIQRFESMFNDKRRLVTNKIGIAKSHSRMMANTIHKFQRC